MKKIFVALFAYVIVGQLCVAQVTIGSDDPPHESAILELKSQNGDKGFLGARVSLLSRDNKYPITGEIAIGLLVYNLSDSPASVDEENKVKAHHFYYWVGDQWIQFPQQEEIMNIVRDTISKIGIPRPAIFKLDGTEIISNGELGIKNFVKDLRIGNARDLPLVENVNNTDGAVRLAKLAGDQSNIIFKPGTYSVTFVYGFYGTGDAPSGCLRSSYFMDFPLIVSADRARIHSNCTHGSRTYGQHGGSINYVVNLTAEFAWRVQLGMGQSADVNCLDSSMYNGAPGFDLRNNSTYVYISKIDE